MVSPDSVELAYAAGFIDGDGCVTLSTQATSGQLPYLHVRLEASGVDERPLVRLQRLLGGTIILNVSQGGNRRARYLWKLVGAAAVEALHHLSPYLSLKRDQAGLAIHAFESWKLYQEDFGHSTRNWPVGAVEQVKEERAQLALQMRVLNKRGV